MIKFARRRVALAAALVWLGYAGGCSDDTRYVSVGDGRDGAVGSGDAAADGGMVDGSMNGSSGNGSGHGGTLPDGAPIDGAADEDGGAKEPELDPTESCDVAEEFSSYMRAIDFANEGGFCLTTGPEGFGLAFQSKAGGYALNTMPVDGAGQFGKVARQFYESGSHIGDVALLWNQSGWRMTWIDNLTGSNEVHTIALSDNLKAPSSAKRTTLTDNDLVESRPVMADIAGVPMLAWIATDMTGKQVRISGKRLDASSSVVDYVAKNAGHAPVSLALTRIGHAGAALGWVDEVAERGVWMQMIDDAGQPTGEPVRLSDKASAGSSLDLATRNDEGGAALYSVAIGGTNREIRFRRLDDKGAFMGQDIKIVSSPLQGMDASLARLGVGYVVAYRALPGGAVTKPEIRIMFISKEGNVQHDRLGRLMTYPIAEASGAGGRTTVRVSLDGQILVAFLDGADNLRLARQRLDCQK